jgi:hypothetical protein
MTNVASCEAVKSHTAPDIHPMTAMAHSVAMKDRRKSNSASRTMFGDGACVKRQCSASNPCRSPPAAHPVYVGVNHVGGFGATGANTPCLTGTGSGDLAANLACRVELARREWPRWVDTRLSLVVTAAA